MRRLTIRGVLLAAAFVNLCAIGSSFAGELRAWGLDRDGQVSNVPTGSDFVAVAAGDAHGLALKSDGTVVAWGQNDDGECNVPEGTYKAIGAGADFSLAIRTDGSIAAWGYDGQRQVSSVPEGHDFVAVDGGELFAVALKADGSIVAWGYDRWGQVSDAPTGTGFKAAMAGDDHAVALAADGSLICWGYWAAIENVPTSGAYAAIAAGGAFCLGLKDDGSIVWWGSDSDGCDTDVVPTGTDFADVAAGYLHGLALKKDGSIIGWGAGVDKSGNPNWGQAVPPEGNNFTALACGLYFSAALAGKDDSGGDDDDDATIFTEDFNDDSLSDSWMLQSEDLSNCSLQEANQRLELITTAKASGISAYCVGSGWQIDPKADFSFKVNYHYSAITKEDGWMFVGIVPDANDLDANYVKFGVGCDSEYPYIWYESIDGTDKQLDYSGRRVDDGALYVSYSAASDELYLSTEGYGSENAWAVISGALQTSWRGAAVTVLLGGGAEGLELTPGDAWLDDFVIETGTLSRPAADPISDVYRFWSPVTQRHFYTIDAAERDYLIANYSNFWTYEGAVFKAATEAFQEGLLPVYRFWSDVYASHFYTIDEAEKAYLIEMYSDVWTFECTAFYAYPEGRQPSGCVPVYRFWKLTDNSHFYTIDEAERDMLMKDYSSIYTYEGIAYYAYGL
ncbi:MAG: hypothetical protein ACM3VT_09205 [Solirubrobacterales bacterium]